MMLRMREFWSLPRSLRLRLVWGTRFRILSFAMGAPVGLLFFGYAVVIVTKVEAAGLSGKVLPPLPLPLMAWLFLVGLMWLGSVFIGSWLNLRMSDMSWSRRATEIAKAMTLAPIAGISESAAGLWAASRWIAGYRHVSWQPTPKTKEADMTMDWAEV